MKSEQYLRRYVLGAIASVALLASCAKSPSSIAPVAVASSEYDRLGCTDARLELSSVEAKLADATRRQNNAQTADAVGVFLFLIPVSALAGDAESDVAQYKGEKLALERAIERKDCSGSPTPSVLTFPSLEARDKYFDDLIVNAQDGAKTDISKIVSQCGSASSEVCQARIKVVETGRDKRIEELEAMRKSAKIGET